MMTGERTPGAERTNTDAPPPSGIVHRQNISIAQSQSVGLSRSRPVGFVARLAQRLRVYAFAGGEVARRLLSKVRGPTYQRAEQARVRAAAIEEWPPDGRWPKEMSAAQANDRLCARLGRYGDHLRTYRRAMRD